jgi:hypothetical protein
MRRRWSTRFESSRYVRHVSRSFEIADRKWDRSLSGKRKALRRRTSGHSDVSTTMIYTHVMNKGARSVPSPLDRRQQPAATYAAR